jgi:hypothetical protein
MYPVVLFDALPVKIREDAMVRNKAIYLALGVLPDGTRDILGLWIENTEGAKFWLKVSNDLKTRGCNDILIAVTDCLEYIAGEMTARFDDCADADAHSQWNWWCRSRAVLLAETQRTGSRPPPSSSGWHCAIFPPIGAARRMIGKKP